MTMLDEQSASNNRIYNFIKEAKKNWWYKLLYQGKSKDIHRFFLMIPNKSYGGLFVGLRYEKGLEIDHKETDRDYNYENFCNLCKMLNYDYIYFNTDNHLQDSVNAVNYIDSYLNDNQSKNLIKEIISTSKYSFLG